MDTNTTAASDDAALAQAFGSVPPEAVRVRGKWERFFRGILEGVGFVAIVAGLGTWAYMANLTPEDEGTGAARAAFEQLASRVCPMNRATGERPQLRTPMEGEAPVRPYVPGEDQYNCLIQKLVDAPR